MPINPSKSRDLADENNKILTEWKLFETTVNALCITTGGKGCVWSKEKLKKEQN
jgi:hypothetical protein